MRRRGPLVLALVAACGLLAACGADGPPVRPGPEAGTPPGLFAEEPAL